MPINRRMRWSVLAPAVLMLLILASLAGPALADYPYSNRFPPAYFPILNTDAADPCGVDELVQYSIDVANMIPPEMVMCPPEWWAEIQFSVLDVLPAGLTYVSSTPAGYYDADQHTLKWELGGLGFGAHRTMQVVLRPDAAAMQATTVVTNRAQLWIRVPGPMYGPSVEPQDGQLLDNELGLTMRFIINECAETTTIANDAAGKTLYSRTFRQGVDGYLGAADTHLDQNNAPLNFGSSPWMYLKTVGSSSIALRFDLSSLPDDAEITTATLRLYVGGATPANVPMTLQLYGLSRSWSEVEASWLRADASTAWQGPGANGPADRSSLPAAEIACYQPALSPARTLEFDVSALGQQWSSNPSSNFGVILKAGICRGTALYSVYSSNSRTLERRPELYVEYMAAPAQ